MKYQIKDIPVHIFLGITKDEQSEIQKIVVSVKFDFDSLQAQESDNITDTVDYDKIYKFVQNFPENRHFRLVEKLHRELSLAIKQEFPQIQNPKIQIQKFPFESGSVVMED